MTDRLVAVLAFSDTVTSLKTRAMIMIGVVAAMFLVAAVVLLVGKRRQKAANARGLADLTGSVSGTRFGDDEPSASADWYASAVAEGQQQTEPTQNWRDVILGDGDGLSVPAAPQYPQARPVSQAPQYAQAAPVAPAHAVPMWAEPAAPVSASTGEYRGRRRAPDDNDEPTYPATPYAPPVPAPEPAQPAAPGPYASLADDPAHLAASQDFYDRADTADTVAAAVADGTATWQDSAYAQPAPTGHSTPYEPAYPAPASPDDAGYAVTPPPVDMIQWADTTPEGTDSGDTSEWWRQALAEDDAAL